MTKNNKLQKLKQKMSFYPYKTLKQTITKEQSIYVFDISDKINCDEISNLCLAHKEENKNSQNTKDFSLDWIVRSWSTDYIRHKNISKPFLELFDIVENHVQRIDKNYTYYVDHFWYVVYETNDSTIPHAHGHCDYASVFYPKVPKNSSPLCFKHDGPKDNSDCINVKTGNLVIFPGELLHYVPKSLHEGERISISMNLFKNSKLNTKQSQV